LWVPDTKFLFERRFFDAFAAEFGLAALEGARLLGRAVPEDIEKRLMAVRARGKA
jgi:hypothetical protein